MNISDCLNNFAGKARSLLTCSFLCFGLLGAVEVQAATVVTLTASSLADSFHTGNGWSDGLAPHAGADYQVNGSSVLRTTETPTFGGDSLTIGNGGTSTASLLLKGVMGGNPTLNIAHLTLNHGSINPGNSYKVTYTGNIDLVSENKIEFTNQSGFTVSSSSLISGTGSLLITSYTASTAPIVFKSSNTYSGGTTLNAGMMEVQAAGGLGVGDVTLLGTSTLKLLSSSAIASSAALYLNSTASVVLSYVGTSTVYGLSFDGGTTLAAEGTWGAVGSGADHTSSLLSGTGLLLVSSTIPEPSSVALVAGVFVLLGAVIRRHSRAV
jgi:hypothetical protein